MKQMQTIMDEYKITKQEYLEAVDNCIRHFLSDDELEPYLIKVAERKIAYRIALKKLKGGRKK